MMDDLEKIKQEISIFELAEMFNANPNGKGKCKHNPLRSEKTSSLQLYESSNSYCDFGDSDGGSSTIDFYQKATGKTLAESINDLKDIANIEVKPKKLAPIPEQDYMSAQVVRKVFDKQIELNFKDTKHKKLLDDYAPKWVFQSAKDKDIAFFVSSVRKARHEDTTMILIRDEHGHETSLKYRFKMVGENNVKWCGMEGTKSNFLYTRLTENPLTIVTEGTSDYLVAILLGYSVISIPSASYKGNIPLELTKDRELIFMGDDGEAGQNAIKRIYEETICNKKLFNYDEFRKLHKKKGSDFKDFLLEFKDTAKFKKALFDYVSEVKSDNLNDWQSILKKKDNTVTRQKIKETENMRILIDGLLPHNQITTFVGQPNVGKSALTFAILNRLFTEEKIDNVIYFDADNPLVYTKERILQLMDKNGDENVSYYTGSTASKNDMLDDLELLTQFEGKGKDTIVVVDSLKNFINGSINDDKSLNPMFDLLQQIRDVFGATIIVLHHTRKGKDEDGKLNYVGSQVIEASSDNMTYLSKVEDLLVLENAKARALLTPELAFSLDFNTMEFNLEDMPVEKSEEDSLAVIMEAMGDGEYLMKDVKALLKGKVGANKVGAIIKEHKGTKFKWRKDDTKSNGWLVSVKLEEPKYKDAVYEADFKMEDIAGLM